MKFEVLRLINKMNPFSRLWCDIQ